MALTFKDKGRAFAKIEGGKLSNKVLFVNEEENEKTFNKLSINDGKLQQIPDPETERNIMYITGPSGCGKSTYTANYTRLYKKVFKKNPIYIFSALKDDKTLDVLEPKRFKIDKESLIDDPIHVEDLKHSLCIFDDIDSIAETLLKNAVYKLLDSILTTGRHFFISCIITNHLPSSGHLTRQILNECHSVTYFKGGNSGKLNRFLMEQIGLDKRDIIENRRTKSRWCTIFKNYPMVNMTEKSVKMLDIEEDESDIETKVKKISKKKK
jgi:energy-coupling factor transporter ATP-binding protein EcfA2